MKRFANMPLGGLPPTLRQKPRLRFARFLSPVAAPPASADYSTGIPSDGWGMMANDTLGCCVIAAAGHAEMGWTVNAGDPYTPPDADIVAAYSAITGYVAGDPSTDNGTDPADMLAYWKSTGISGHTIGAYAAIDPSHPTQFKLAISMFECALVSLALPAYWQTLENNGDVWDVPPAGTDSDLTEPGSWGYHEVAAFKYDADGLYIVTWGETICLTWAAVGKYVDGGNVMFSTDLVNGTTAAPTGFDIAVLQSDLPLIAGA